MLRRQAARRKETNELRWRAQEDSNLWQQGPRSGAAMTIPAPQLLQDIGGVAGFGAERRGLEDGAELLELTDEGAGKRASSTSCEFTSDRLQIPFCLHDASTVTQRSPT